MASLRDAALGAASLREIRSGSPCSFKACCGRCGLFLEGLLIRATQDRWMRAEALGIHGPCGNRRSWVAGTWMLSPLCAISRRDISSSHFGGDATRGLVSDETGFLKQARPRAEWGVNTRVPGQDHETARIGVFAATFRATVPRVHSIAHCSFRSMNRRHIAWKPHTWPADTGFCDKPSCEGNGLHAP